MPTILLTIGLWFYLGPHWVTIGLTAVSAAIIAIAVAEEEGLRSPQADRRGSDALRRQYPA